MNFSNFNTILLSGASVTTGALLGVLRSKIFSSKNSNRLYFIFYTVSGLVFLFAILTAILWWHQLFVVVDLFGVVVLIIALASSIGLFFVSHRHLVIKDTYQIPELDPIVNDFTTLGDKDEIRLFGGDFSFLGGDPGIIDKHSQYKHLKNSGFRRVLVLCETPISPIQKIRYGMMLSEIRGIEMRFYEPESADLKVRGRIIEVQGVSRLLMYTKIEDGVYQAIATDTASTNGALYSNLWDLVWSLAIVIPDEVKRSYINKFRGED